MLAPLALLGLVTIQVIQDEGPVAPLSPDAAAEFGENEAPPAAESASVVLQQVVAHCEIALGEGQCQAASQDAPASARVVFETNRVVITLLDEPALPTRSLEFSPADSTDQRQVAAGLLVAAMSAAARSEQEARARDAEEQVALQEPKESEKKPPEQKPESSELSKVDEEKPTPQFLFDIGGTLSPPLGGSTLRLGGLLKSTWQTSTLLGVFGELRFSQSLGNPPRLRLADAGIGASMTLTRFWFPRNDLARRGGGTQPGRGIPGDRAQRKSADLSRRWKTRDRNRPPPDAAVAVARG